MTIHRLQSAVLAIVLAILSACSGDGTLTVSVQTSLVPGRQFSIVDVSIVDPIAVTDGVSVRRHDDRAAAFGDDYVHGLQVASFSDVPPGDTVVRVRLVQPDGLRLLERRVRVNIADGSSNFALLVRMSRDCLDVTCPNAAGSAALSECLAGQCVDERCSPPSHDFCPETIFCNVDDDCPEPASCARRRCLDGLCEAEPIDDACPANEWCDPSSDLGCTPISDPDAGAADAGFDAPIDAGPELDAAIDATADANVDAGPICGTVCRDGLDECHFGYWDCSIGTPTCSAILPRWAGSGCGENLVCDGRGACVACEEGVACLVNGCIPGVTSCATGASGCVATAPPLPSGTECATDSVCTTAGACVFAPDEGDPCDDACAHGTYDYASGSRACETDGTPSDAGTFCGDGRVCDGAGTCNDCPAMESCIVDCWYGSYDCSSGSPVCTMQAPTPYGAACPGGVCDGSGTCTSCTPGDACDVENQCRTSVVDCSMGVRCVPSADMPIGTTCDFGICNGQGECVAPLEAISMRISQQHGCAILTDGTLKCWGNNSQGELGVGTTTPPFFAPYFKSVVPGLSDLAELEVASQRTCVRSVAGAVWCWGINNRGQIGDGTTVRRTSPTSVTLPLPAIDIAVSSLNTCAVLSDHTARCWGSGGSGALGNGLTGNASTPQVVTGVTDAERIALTASSMCILRTNGNVACTGSGGNGAGTGRILVVADVAGIDEVTELSLQPEAFSYACAVRTGGRVTCWSSAIEPDLDLPFDDPAKIIVYANGPSNIRCIMRVSGEVWCDGPNHFGALGRGDGPSDPPSPWGPVAYIDSATDLIPYTCAGIAGGYWECWGFTNYFYGVYGTGNYMNYFYYPTLAVASP